MRDNMTDPAITINGKPLYEYLDEDIPRALATETESELTRRECEAVDSAID